MKKLVSILFLIPFIFCCSNRKNNLEEKKLAIKLSNHLIKKDSLNINNFSKDVSFHIISEKLNNNNYLTRVSLNHLKLDSNDFHLDTLTIGKFKTYIYYSTETFNLSDVFWIPDAKSWRFFIKKVDTDFIFFNLKTEPMFLKDDSKDILETDF